MMTFITHVGKLRREKGLKEGRDISQRGLAKEIDVAADTINRWENNQIKQVDYETARKLMEYFEVKLSALIDIEDTQS